MNELDYAWAAGFVDGEGSFKISFGASGAHYSSLTVFNVYEEPIRKLQTIFGGNVGLHRSKYVNHNDAFYWRIGGPTAVVALTCMLPYLTVKRRQAETILKFQSTVPPTNIWGSKGVPTYVFQARQSLREVLHKLNKRGRAA